MKKLVYIDSLRGIAILMVIIVHNSAIIQQLSPNVKLITSYGQMGVQLFFLLSAMTLTISNKSKSNESSHILKFYIRRFFRIAPLYYFGIVLYFFVWALRSFVEDGKFLKPEGYTAQNIMANIVFVHGFYPPANNSIVPGGWSIGTEMAFYVIFPMLFYIIDLLAARFSVKIVIWFSVLIFTVNIAAQVLIMDITKQDIQNNSFLYYNLLNQLPVFSLGITLHFMERAGYFANYSDFFNVIMFSAITIFLLSIWNSQLPLIYAVIPYISGISFIFLYLLFQRNQAINHLVLRRIGELSYSIYIFHFVVIVIANLIYKRYLTELNDVIVLIFLFCFTVFFTFLIAQISERLIEKPGIVLGKILTSKLSGLLEIKEQ
jgi:peptidoglycan/LPS O-acetylase OafA/YrhL